MMTNICDVRRLGEAMTGLMLVGCVLIAGLVASGCEAEVVAAGESPDYSEFSDYQRSEIRRVLRHFDGSSPDGLSVPGVMGLIVQEGQRLVPHTELNDDHVQPGVSFPLSALFAQQDYWGDSAESMGFVSFGETIHNTEGDATSGTTYKPVMYFTTGAVGGFHSRDGNYGADAELYTTVNAAGFDLSSDAEFVQELWHQRRAVQQSSATSPYFGDYAETYTYTSHPTLQMTVNVGSYATSETKNEESLVEGSGWDTTQTASGGIGMAGEITRYRPRVDNAPANTTGVSSYDEDETVSDNVATLTTDVTTRDSSDVNIGSASELYENTTVTTTVHTVSERDAMTGATISSTSEEHTTIEVSYLRRTGYGLEVLKTHGLETVFDYVETYRVLTQVDATYEPASTVLASCTDDDDCDDIGFGFECATGHDGSKRCLSNSACGSNALLYGTSTEGEAVCGPRATRVSTTTVYRYTDNPRTRNNLEAYKSTTQTVRETWSDDDWTYVDEGVQWLTDEIEVDSDYDAVGYSLNSEWTTTMAHTTRFLGGNLTATETHDRTDVEMNMQATWDQDIVSVSGSHVTTSASLSNGAHSESLASNADGTYTVELNDASASVGAEEWLDNMAP